jgi:hypothetical protein
MSLKVTPEVAEDVETHAIKPIPAASAVIPMARLAPEDSRGFWLP